MKSEIEIWTDLHDPHHPWVAFPDPCGPPLILINDKLYTIHLVPLNDGGE